MLSWPGQELPSAEFDMIAPVTRLSMDTIDIDTPSWVSERRLPGSNSEDIRRAVVEDLMRLGRSNLGIYHGVLVRGGAIHFGHVDTFGDRETLKHLLEIEGRPVTDFADVESRAWPARLEFSAYPMSDSSSTCRE